MSKDKRPGDQLACPLCRKRFILPRSGVSDLPKNFFIANFLQARESTSVESKKTSPCEACSGGEGKVQNAASVYCVECEMKLCQICERGHKVIKTTRSHKLVDIRVDRCREMLESLEKEKKELIGQVEKTGVEIREKAEQLKRMIDNHTEKLINELSSVKRVRTKEIESLRDIIKRQLMSME